MLRNEWEFDYSAQDLANAARTKAQHHMERRQWWDAQKNDVVEKIRAEGLDIEESMASVVSNSYGRGATVTIDLKLQRDLTECVDKVREHREKAEAYDAWYQTLTANPTSRLKLHHDDWMFFFGQ